MALPTPEEEQALRDRVSIAVLQATISKNNMEILDSRGTLQPNIMREIFIITDAYIAERNKREEK